jgi:hypothetical protein
MKRRMEGLLEITTYIVKNAKDPFLEGTLAFFIIKTFFSVLILA